MSIAVKDVLERILSEVSRAPGPALDLQLFRGNELSDPRRNATVGVAHGPATGPGAFTSNLHFWAWGLLAFMRDRGSEGFFMASAERCLCSQLDEGETNRQVEQFFSLLASPRDLDLIEGASAGYRMFQDGNRRSILIETPMRYVGFYWENDTVLPAFDALLRALCELVSRETGSDANESWVVAQQDSDLDDPSDAIYLWRVAPGRVESLDPDGKGRVVQVRFLLTANTDRIDYVRVDAQGAAHPGVCFVRGEGTEILLEG